jgi:hypothetical protein
MPYLSVVSMLLSLALSAGAALSQSPPADPATTSVEADEEKADAAAIANCEAMWDRDTHMTKKEWSQTCRRVQTRLRRMEWK